MKSHKLIKSPTVSGKCVLVLLILIFCLTMTSFVMNEVQSPNRSNNTVIRILLNSLESPTGAEDTTSNNATQFLLINVEQSADNSAIDESGRRVRQAFNATRRTQSNYYEEQQPVIVHAESAVPVYRPPSSADLQQNSAEDRTVSEVRPDYAYDNDEDFYYPKDPAEYDGNNRRFDEDDAEGRSAQHQQYPPGQWNYNPWPVSGEKTDKGHAMGMKQTGTSTADGNYADDVAYYDYPMGFVQRQRTNTPRNQFSSQETQVQVRHQQPHNSEISIPKQQQKQQPQQRQQQNKQQQYQSMAPTANSESSLLSVVNGLKIMWDIYQAFSAAWNTIAEHREKHQNGLRENLKQQQQRTHTRSRINSRKPPKFTNNATVIEAIDDGADDNEDKNDKSVTNDNTNTKNNTNTNNNRNKNDKPRSTKSPKVKSTTKSSVTTTLNPTKIPSAKVEPRTGPKGERKARSEVSGLRERRATGEAAGTDSTSVGEGRYIKGDPLKGYYDFVITEGSYKFWAVFQTGTAILIIYSVFAAIYYSKVNPLVSDYDYTDYLGGARSLGGGDLDFVDDEDDHKKSASAAGWLTDVVPKAAHSLKFILEAIDKLPADHGEGAANEAPAGRDTEDAASSVEYGSREDYEESAIANLPT